MTKYTATKKCKNCGRLNWVQCEKGKTVKEHCLENKFNCEGCECLLYEEEKNAK
jgi:hypothetical protein